jgi:hypothetical protein
MKTIFITFITAFALTSAATAHSWMWFQGDIGIGSSPSVSSSSSANINVKRGGPQQKTASQRAVTGSKSKSADKRITAR